MTTVRLCVYGTLKSNHPNHSILGKEAKVLARGVRIPGMSLWHCGWFPGVIKDPEGPGVEVEVVEVPITALFHIDGYEGYEAHNPLHSLFIRETITLPDGEEAVIYIYNRDPRSDQVTVDRYQMIPSGIWEAPNRRDH